MLNRSDMRRIWLRPAKINHAFALAAQVSRTPLEFELRLGCDAGQLNQSVTIPGVRVSWHGTYLRLIFDHKRMDGRSAVEVLRSMLSVDALPLTALPNSFRLPVLVRQRATVSRPPYGWRHPVAYRAMRSGSDQATVYLQVSSERRVPLADLLADLHIRITAGQDKCSSVEVAVACPRFKELQGTVGNYSASIYSHCCPDGATTIRERARETMEWAKENRLLPILRLQRIGRLPAPLRQALSLCLKIGGYPKQSALITELVSDGDADDSLLSRVWFVVPARSRRSVTISSIRLSDGSRRVALSGFFDYQDLEDFGLRLLCMSGDAIVVDGDK